MLDVYREMLPNGFLLILSPDIACQQGEIKLTRALHRASRSAKRAVLVDCSLVERLTEEAVDLLLAYAFMLRNQSRRLVLCHVPNAVSHHFLNLDVASQPMLVSLNGRHTPAAYGGSGRLTWLKPWSWTASVVLVAA